MRRGSAGSVLSRTSGGQVFVISLQPPAPQGPICEVELNQAIYLTGDSVVATSLRIANPTAETIAVEGKLWFDRPGARPFARTGILPPGSVDLAPGSDRELGPVTLATVAAGLPRGTYAFNCRLIDPVTGDHLVLDANPFELR